MTFNLTTPHEAASQIAERVKQMRLSLNMSQRSLSQRSGVSFGVLKKFEHTGKISLESLLKLALALDCLDDFESIFKESSPQAFTTLDRLLKQKTRKRGRR